MMDDTSWMMDDSSFVQLGFLRDSLVAFMQGSWTRGDNYGRQAWRMDDRR